MNMQTQIDRTGMIPAYYSTTDMRQRKIIERQIGKAMLDVVCPGGKKAGQAIASYGGGIPKARPITDRRREVLGVIGAKTLNTLEIADLLYTATGKRTTNNQVFNILSAMRTAGLIEKVRTREKTIGVPAVWRAKKPTPPGSAVYQTAKDPLAQAASPCGSATQTTPATAPGAFEGQNK